MNDKFCYFPLIRTRDSELRCFEHLENEVLSCTLPVYELTRSRKTTKDPDGAISKVMERISNIQKNLPFILDLTASELYTNAQIKDLLDPNNGYSEWQRFVFNTYKDLNIIPVIHVNEDRTQTDYSQLCDFVLTSPRKNKLFAIRIPIDLPPTEITYLFEKLQAALVQVEAKVIVLMDAGFVGKNVSVTVELFTGFSKVLDEYAASIYKKVMLCTSFPKNVAQGRNEHEDSFRIYEEEIYQKVKNLVADIGYGDYCSINTEQIERAGGGFIPRIDVASTDGNSFSYKRYRQSEGGYVRCAKRTIEDTRCYTDLKTWADEKIQEASAGKPYRLNPSSWIAVRMNYYIKTRVLLRKTN